MKLYITAGLLFLCSCSSTTILTKIGDDKKDVLRKESLLRYSSDRLNNIKTKDRKQLALIDCHKNNTKKGLKKLKRAFIKEKNKNNYLIWNNIGTCYYLKANYIKAEFYFQYSLNVSKKMEIKNPEALNNLGLIAIRNRNYYFARDFFYDALKESPGLLTPKYNMAQLNLQFSRIENAQEILKELYRVNPQDKDIISSLGTSYMLQGDYIASLKFFEMIDRDSIRRTDMALHYSLSLFETGQYKKANEILKISNRSKTDYLNLTRNKLQLMINQKIKEIKQDETIFDKSNKTVQNEKRG